MAAGALPVFFQHPLGESCVAVPDRSTTVLSSVLEAVGNTPCIELQRVPKLLGLKCRVVAKCEFLNPGGSVKDRIGRLMLLDAEREGLLKPGDELIEPTSGNTGIGLSMAAAAKGYKMTITMPTKMSAEKERALNALGAKVIRTPMVDFDHPDSLISVAWRMQKEHPETRHVLDQYKNSGNPNAHYYGTGEEIFRQTGGKVDMVVMGTGTGGTMTGVAKRLKEKIPGVQVVGVDPVGSILADPAKPPPPGFSYHVEGIGYDFIPHVCERGLVDVWVKSEDAESFKYARMIQRHEGLLVGGSSGSAFAGVVAAAKDLGPEHTVVVVFPDSIRNYMAKFADDNWMVEKGFSDLITEERRALGGVVKPTYEALEKENGAMKAKIAALEAELAARK